MSFRKYVYIKVGGWNPDLFQSDIKKFLQGDGESGLCRKIKKLGKKIIYTPYAVVYHVIPERRLSIEYLRKKAFGTWSSDVVFKVFRRKISTKSYFIFEVKCFFYSFYPEQNLR
jgi:GT2 family glycosyltransferase